MWSSLVILALLASAQGRAVNISNTWVLPEDGFPVFYRYFRDRISWYEADAVCQFHHANLVTVDTTAQYDAVRAYLKELDISSAVWVGLIRSNPDGDFTWTDYRGLSGDGYWSTAPDTRSAPLCAAANPIADYRWEARACGGPTVASFICELSVPQWALGDEGCMVKELPALTILYLPESAAVQLNGDCGLAGVKRVQCTGNVKREDLMKDLSCGVEEDMYSSPASTSMSTAWYSTPDPTDDAINEVTTEQITSTEHGVDVNQQILITATSIPQYINSRFANINTMVLSKNINLAKSHDHNTQSNIIPKIVEVGNVLTNDPMEKLEDERQTIMFHDELARVGNPENIFTQPTDHFIPPLVMAKSRMSDDMTVLSLAEKHAQQLAEKHFNKHSQNNNINDKNKDKLSLENASLENPPTSSEKFNNNVNEEKKENLKSHVPKKYVNEKYYETKGKVVKILGLKTSDLKVTPIPTFAQDVNKFTSTIAYPNTKKTEDDFGMDLTVMLRDATYTSEEEGEKLNTFSGDIVKFDSITKKQLQSSNPLVENSPTTEHYSTTTTTKPVDDNTSKHEIIKITVISNTNADVNTTVFEITTKMPIFKDDIGDNSKLSTNNPTTLNKMAHTEEVNVITTESVIQSNPKEVTGTLDIVEALGTVKPTSSNLTSPDVISTTIAKPLISTPKPLIENQTELTKTPTTETTTSVFQTEGVTTRGIDKITTDDTSTVKQDNVASTHSYEPEKNHESNSTIIDQQENNMTDTEYTGDENSPLLSGSYEPIHRPARTRTPQQQNRKFNPFRILG